ncbi:MAG: type I 3-dehydroquinate dehydratase [Bacteroidales bacterium]|nr:type I 3-dehydroquinate dehydratase [Bacteroidales bacterium]
MALSEWERICGPRMYYVCLSAEGIENATRQLADELCAELRIDLVKPTMDEMKKFLADHNDVRFIVTCRPGAFDEETSLQYLETAAKCGAEYIDVEIERGKEIAARLKKACEGTECQLIISYHNFEYTPGEYELLSIIDKSKDWGADKVKIACNVPIPEANAALMHLYNLRDNIIVFGMGRLGKISRLASLWCGAEFTYVAADCGEATAPGQLTISQMRQAVDALGMFK